MARVNLSIPDELREKMLKRDTEFNWSAIACEAFRLALVGEFPCPHHRLDQLLKEAERIQRELSVVRQACRTHCQSESTDNTGMAKLSLRELCVHLRQKKETLAVLAHAELTRRGFLVPTMTWDEAEELCLSVETAEAFAERES